MPVQIPSPLERFRQFCVTGFGPQVGQRLYQAGLELENPDEQVRYFRRLIAKLAGHRVQTPVEYRWKPVDVETFIKDKFYLNFHELYPESLPFIKEMNSGDYIEVIATGGIGSGKSTAALLTNAYQVYLLSCMENPHAAFGLDRSSEIEIIFQNITQKLAESVDYARFKEMILRSPYFQKHFAPNPELKSELHFPNRVIVKPVSGSNLATIGQNIIGHKHG